VEHGAAATTVCEWSFDRSFLVRSHRIASCEAGKAAPLPPEDAGIPQLLSALPAGHREIIEVIGWDAQRGEIRSWLFGTGGGLAEGAWTQQGDGWVIHLQGGGAASGENCTCTLEQVGSGEFRVHGDRSGLCDALPPAGTFLRTGRVGQRPLPLSD